MRAKASVERAGALSGLRVMFFGLGGVFSRLPLEALLRAGADLRAIATLAQPGMSLGEAADLPYTRLEPRPARATRLLPLAGGAPLPRTLRDLAAEAGAPLLSVARLRDAATLEALASFAPDAICVACFTRRLPPARRGGRAYRLWRPRPAPRLAPAAPARTRRRSRRRRGRAADSRR